MKFQLIEIHWDDAATDHGWEHSDDVVASENIAITIGWLVKENDKHLVIASTVCDDGSCNGRINIPKGMVVKKKVLRGIKPPSTVTSKKPKVTKKLPHSPEQSGEKVSVPEQSAVEHPQASCYTPPNQP